MDSLPKKNQYIYALLLLMSTLVSVSLISVLGTALPDLICISNTDLKSASLILLAFGTGKCVTPFLGIVMNFSSVLPMLATLALTVIAFLLVFIPTISILKVTAFIYLFIGTAGGVLDVARYTLPAMIWKASNVGFYLVSAGAGITALVAPMVTSLFVNNQRHTGINSTNSGMTTCETNIEIPYTVLALLSILTACGFAFNDYNILNQGKQLEDTRNNENSTQKSNDQVINKCFYVTVLVYFVTITSCIMTVFSLMVTYGLRSDQHIDVKTSSAMTSLFGICFLLSRLLCACIADKVKPSTILWTSLALVNSASVLFLIFKDSSIPILWLVTAVHGFGTGPMFVSLVTWSRQYIPLSTRFISAFLLMDNIGNVIHPTVTGVLMDVYGVDLFIYTIVGTRFSQLLLFICLQLIVKRI